MRWIWLGLFIVACGAPKSPEGGARSGPQPIAEVTRAPEEQRTIAEVEEPREDRQIIPEAEPPGDEDTTVDPPADPEVAPPAPPEPTPRPKPTPPKASSDPPPRDTCETHADCTLLCPDTTQCCANLCGCQTAVSRAFADWAAKQAPVDCRGVRCPAVGCLRDDAFGATCREGRCRPSKSLGF